MIRETIPTLLKSARWLFFAFAFLQVSRLLAQDPDPSPPPLLEPPAAAPLDAPIAPDPMFQPEVEWDPLPPAPDEAAEPTPIAAEAVPLPEEETPLELPAAPETVTVAPDDFQAPDMKKEPSEVDVWRPTSEFPQSPPSLIGQFKETFVADANPVIVQVQFDPLTAGKTVMVQMGEGVAVLPEGELTIDANGLCVFSVQLDNDTLHSLATLVCDGQRTVIPISRTTLAEVIEKENETGGAQ